jgi:hypothetical protein
MKCVPVYCFLFLTVNLSLAQPGSVFVTGDVFAKQGTGDNLSGVESVTVRLIIDKDTLLTATDKNGQFIFKKVPVGKGSIRFSHINYKTASMEIETVPRKDVYKHIILEEISYKIGEVVLKSSIPVVLICGDTLVYNAAAILTMKGDEALEIVRQLPGVQVDDDGSVTIMGKRITRTYINKKLIFGDDPRTALRELLAEQVSKIQVYGEATDEERRRKIQSDRKQMVMDIETKSDITSAYTGHFLASTGSDLSKDESGKIEPRYGIGATMNFFSEMNLLSINAFYNNLDRRSNRLQDILSPKKISNSYNENGYFQINAEKYWKERLDGSFIKTSYVFDRNLSRSKEILWRSYFPASGYSSREYSDTTLNRNTSGIHRFNADLQIKTFLDGRLSSTTALGLRNVTNNYSKLAENITDNFREGLSVVKRADNKEHYINQNITWTLFTTQKKRIYPAIVLSAGLGDNDGGGYRIDTMSVAGKKIIHSSSDGLARDLSGMGHLTIQLDKDKTGNSALFFVGGITYLRKKERQFSINVFDPTIDPSPIDTASTFDYTYRYITAKVDATLRTIILNKIGIHFRLGAQSSLLCKDEAFPEVTGYEKRYNSLTPALRINYSRGLSSSLILDYSSRPVLPSLEQTRPQVNDENPVLLRGGNPSLKQSLNHSLQFKYVPGLKQKGTSFEISSNVNLTQNLIASKSQYFSESTLLPQFGNYTAPAGSNLYTYENVNGAFNITSDVSYSKYIRTLKSTLRFSVNHAYNRLPTFLGDELFFINTNKIGSGISLKVPFSKNHRIGLSLNTSFTNTTRPSMTNNRYITESINVSIESTFTKHIFLNGEYNYSGHQFIKENRDNINNHLLNIVAGYKINRLALSLSGYDLLNNNTGFKSEVISDYLQNRWTPSFGRYWSFNLSYTINSTGLSQKKASWGSRLEDGGVYR